MATARTQIEYGITPSRVPRRALTVAGAAIATILVIIAGSAIVFGRFHSTSICTVCGAAQHSTAWQIPLTDVTYGRWRSVEATPLSKLVDQRKIVGDHQHAYVFTGGSGNGILCALGVGAPLLNTTGSESARFVASLDEFRGRDEARLWLGRLLDWQKDPAPRRVVQLLPDEPFADKAAFEQWWVKYQEWIDEASAQ